MLRVCFHFLFQIYSESSSTFLQIYSTSTFSWLVMTFLNWGSTKGVSPSTHTERSLSVLKIVDILWQEKKNLRNQLTQKKKKRPLNYRWAEFFRSGLLYQIYDIICYRLVPIQGLVWFSQSVFSRYTSPLPLPTQRAACLAPLTHSMSVFTQ